MAEQQQQQEPPPGAEPEKHMFKAPAPKKSLLGARAERSKVGVGLGGREGEGRNEKDGSGDRGARSSRPPLRAAAFAFALAFHNADVSALSPHNTMCRTRRAGAAEAGGARRART